MARKRNRSTKLLNGLITGAIKQRESGEQFTPLIAIIVSNFLDRLSFVEFINEQLVWDENQWRVSPGNLAKAIILIPFITTAPRIALIAIEDQFKSIDMSLLFNERIEAEWLTRDAFATMLDRFYDAGCEFIYTNVALKVYSAFNIPFEPVFHGDTTSVSLYGDYDVEYGEDENVPVVCRGISKDGKRNLKQIMIGLIVDRFGIPLHTTVRDGSQNDSKWNFDVIDSLRDLIKHSDENVTYIADSKLATAPNIKKLIAAGFTFVTRCPANFEKKVAQKVTNEAYENDDWEDIGSYRESEKGELVRYEVQEFQKEVCGKICRFLVLRSNDRMKKVNKVLEKEKETIKSLVKESTKKTFSCKADTEKEVEMLKTKLKKYVWSVEITIDSEDVIVEKRGRGRPPKNAPLPKKETEWLIKTGELIKIEEKYEALIRKTETFVLFTNVTANEASAMDIVRLYKEQKTVEDNFSVLKKPSLVDTLFLKLPHRIVALVTILSFGLLIQVIIRILVKRNLDSMEEMPNLDYGGKKLKSIGLKKIMVFLGYYTIISKGNKIDYDCLTDVHKPHIVTWLKLLEIDSLCA